MHIPNYHIAATVAAALQEDIGRNDLTAALIDPDIHAHATLINRLPTTVCGQRWADEVFRQVDPTINLQWFVEDGDTAPPDTRWAIIEGPARTILSAERTALNFLQTLSGTAYTAHTYVTAVSGTGCRILDTRKTIPGLRLEQKYAVRTGGGCNHRTGLYDGVLIKENHIRSAGSITAALQKLGRTDKEILVEIEVENIAELEQALQVGAPRVLLDNFDIKQTRAAVALNAGRAKLEASGNIALDNIREIAETGVDYISVGAITKHLHAADLSLLFATSQ